MAEIKWNNINGKDSGLNTAFQYLSDAQKARSNAVNDLFSLGTGLINQVQANNKQARQEAVNANTNYAISRLNEAQSLDDINQIRSNGFGRAQYMDQTFGRDIDLAKFNEKQASWNQDVEARAKAKDSLKDYSSAGIEYKQRIENAVAAGDYGAAMNLISNGQGILSQDSSTNLAKWVAEQRDTQQRYIDGRNDAQYKLDQDYIKFSNTARQAEMSASQNKILLANTLTNAIPDPTQRKEVIDALDNNDFVTVSNVINGLDDSLTKQSALSAFNNLSQARDTFNLASGSVSAAANAINRMGGELPTFEQPALKNQPNLSSTQTDNSFNVPREELNQARQSSQPIFSTGSNTLRTVGQLASNVDNQVDTINSMADRFTLDSGNGRTVTASQYIKNGLAKRDLKSLETFQQDVEKRYKNYYKNGDAEGMKLMDELYTRVGLYRNSLMTNGDQKDWEQANQKVVNDRITVYGDDFIRGITNNTEGLNTADLQTTLNPDTLVNQNNVVNTATDRNVNGETVAVRQTKYKVNATNDEGKSISYLIDLNQSPKKVWDDLTAQNNDGTLPLGDLRDVKNEFFNLTKSDRWNTPEGKAMILNVITGGLSQQVGNMPNDVAGNLIEKDNTDIVATGLKALKGTTPEDIKKIKKSYDNKVNDVKERFENPVYQMEAYLAYSEAKQNNPDLTFEEFFNSGRSEITTTATPTRVTQQDINSFSQKELKQAKNDLTKFSGTFDKKFKKLRTENGKVITSTPSEALFNSIDVSSQEFLKKERQAEQLLKTKALTKEERNIYTNFINEIKYIRQRQQIAKNQ